MNCDQQLRDDQETAFQKGNKKLAMTKKKAAQVYWYLCVAIYYEDGKMHVHNKNKNNKKNNNNNNNNNSWAQFCSILTKCDQSAEYRRAFLMK